MAPSPHDPHLISIVIPCRNAANSVGRLIERLRSLPIPDGWNVEMVAGYQRSEDDTLSVLQAAGVSVAHCDSFGPGPARNAAVAESHGTYLYFIDADACPARDDLLLRFAEAAEELGDFGGIGGPILLEPRQRRNPIAVADHLACWFNWTASRPSGQTDSFQPTANFAVRREVFEQVGGFDPAFRVLQDFEIQERIRALGLPLYFRADLPVYHHARGTIRSSWGHSWWWGIPFRKTYIDRRRAARGRAVTDRRWFWLHLPRIFRRRLVMISRRSWPASKWQLVLTFPFVVATVLAWSVAVVVGKGQPPLEAQSP
jgi:GT2 family glycosyltransferase